MRETLLGTFNHCYFLTDHANAIIIVVPQQLPQAEIFTIAVSHNQVSFSADYEVIAEVPYQSADIFRRLSDQTQIGMIEYDGEGDFPTHISKIAYVEIWEAAA